MTNLYKFLPEHLRLPSGTFVHGLSSSIDKTHEKLLKLIENCIDQLFLTTATGKYLIKLAEQEGFVMPANSGLDIRAYRILVPLLVSSPKQVRNTIEQIVEAFYGPERMRPSITSLVPSPYALFSGDNLIIETESGKFDLSILDTQVKDINNVDVAEIAAIINSAQNKVKADIVTDRNTLFRYLRMSSSTIGANSFIRVVGGTLQNVLKFPNIIETNIYAGTTFNVSKIRPYTDVTKIEWNGSGFNPRLYLVNKGDFLTIRGLPQNSQNLHLLNGSYEVIDCGYDYIIIRNFLWNHTSGQLICPSPDTLVFTSQVKKTIYNSEEYGLTSETDSNTATITVPAIPPLARRFLSGSAHLHGGELRVINFTRDTITVSLPLGIECPAGDNRFVFRNDKMMYDFSRPFYKTTSVDSSVNPTFIVDSSSKDYSALPPTTPFNIGVNDPIHLEVGSDEITITFLQKHGLLFGWQFTLSDVSGSTGNVPLSLLNGAHVAVDTTSAYKVTAKLKNSLGNPIYFGGIQFGPFELKRYSVARPDGADIYLQFPSIGDVIASGLTVGMTFMIDPDMGTDLDPFYGANIRHQKMYVVSIEGNIVNAVSGYGVGPIIDIISNAYGLRSANIGGSAVKYWFDQTSEWNVNNVMSGLRMVTLAKSTEKNKNYVGSFLFDPRGIKQLFTVSRFITQLTKPILKGGGEGIIFVNKVRNVFNNEDFPQSGKILIDYGNDQAEGPIPYIAVIDGQGGDSQIIIDPSYRFKISHQPGAYVQFLHNNKPFEPGQKGKEFPVYLTGTAQSRATLFKLLEEIIAGGIYLDSNVLLPKLRFSDPSIKPFE